MDIELRLLRSFVAIYELGAISKAASRLACTQAAMSMRLKLLEAEMGEALFLRHHHRLEPTFKGTELYAKALTVLSAYDELVSATRSRRPRHKLRLGFPDDYALGILPGALASLNADAEDAELEIICDLSANLSTAFQRGEVDLALVTLEARPPAALLGVDVALNWVSHPGLALAPEQPVPVAAYPEGCVFRRAMVSSLERARRSWHIAAQSRSHSGIMAAVWGGRAVTAVASGTAPRGLNERNEGLDLPPLPRVPLFLLSRRPSASQALEEAVVELMRSLGQPVPAT